MSNEQKRDIVESFNRTHQLVSFAFFWKNDTPAGFGFEIPKRSFEADPSLQGDLVTVFLDTIKGARHATAAEAATIVLAAEEILRRHRKRRIHSVVEITDCVSALTALITLGRVEDDEYNGLFWTFQRRDHIVFVR